MRGRQGVPALEIGTTAAWPRIDRGLRDLIRRMSRKHQKRGATGDPGEVHACWNLGQHRFWHELCALEPGGQQVPTRSGIGDDLRQRISIN